MNSATDALVGGQHIADLSDTDDGRHVIPGHSDQTSVLTIELRLAHLNDAAAVRRLAELDSSPALTGQVAIALINGDAVTGLSHGKWKLSARGRGRSTPALRGA